MLSNHIRVLQIIANSKNFGGVEAFLLEIYRNIDKSKIQFDFLFSQSSAYDLYKNEIEDMGGHIYELHCNGNKIKRKILLGIRLKKFLKENNYNIVHINTGAFFFNLQVAIIAKITKVRKIIVHSHNVSLESKFGFKRILIDFLKPIIQLFATNYFACSMPAANSLFTKKMINSNKFKIIKNGIDVEKFKFNNKIREEKRKELNIEKKFVIGHIGRFVYQKNHEFLIDVFDEICKQNKNSILLLIGEGELEEKIKNKVEKLKLAERVLFLGPRQDISELLQAMDIFVFPSRYEGLGIVAIEAQCTGLRIILSDSIPKEVKIAENIKFISLNENKKKWSEIVLGLENKENREEAYKNIFSRGYDVHDVVNQLQEFYLR